MKRLFALFLLIVIFAACKENTLVNKPSEHNPFFLHNDYVKVWSITEYYENGTKKALPAWMAGDRYVFIKDGAGIYVYGETDKVTGDTLKTTFFYWEVKNESDTLTITETHQNEPVIKTIYKIIQIADKFGYLEWSDSGIIYKIKIENPVPFNPGATAMNRALTNAGAKLWNLSGLDSNGIRIQIKPYIADDMLLFATDGSGILIHGGINPVIADKDNNDLFIWKFVLNDKIFINNFKHDELYMTDWRIVTLNVDSLVYENTMNYEGKDALIRFTWTPYLK